MLFTLANGRRITVARDGDWDCGSADAAFLRQVRDGGCRVFETTLSPDHNAERRVHLHLDQAQRGGRTFCR